MERVRNGRGYRLAAVWRLPRVDHQIGTLVLDMYHRRPSNLSGLAVLPRPSIQAVTQEKNQKNLDKAMAKLLKNYPPKQS